MKFSVATSALMASCALAGTSAAVTGGAPWGYKTNDATMAGPAQWADHYPTCGGSRQSPIDITTTTGGDVATRSLAFTGECGDFNLTQTADSFKASAVGGSCSAKANGASYKMAQFHLHAPSEHTLNGKSLDGEVHFVHINAAGSALMVVGVFLQVVNGRTDPFMVSVLDGMDNVSASKGEVISLGSYSKLVNANANRLYNYPGSLTTPGCDEIVDWWVVQKPVSVSPKDFKRLQTQLQKLPATNNGKNARPVMPLKGRKVISLQ